MDLPYYTVEELLDAGFKSVGDRVTISRKVSLYWIDGCIGNNVRVDDYCILKGKINLGSYIHIGAYCLISGAHGVVELGNCVTLSAGVHIYTGSDSYRADSLSSSTVPPNMTSTVKGDVTLHTGVIVGANTILLPNTHLAAGVSVGAQCIIHGEISEGAIIVNSSAQGAIVGYRDSRKIIELAACLLGADNMVKR